ncbi:hypothetical protein HAX54_021417, partial [Datura stramonium]|nr:hypothetical protein [Datura stramonium]
KGSDNRNLKNFNARNKSRRPKSSAYNVIAEEWTSQTSQPSTHQHPISQQSLEKNPGSD